ncbi:MAG: hypothetical protein DMG06_25315 [Acidobacteria bacterium]|nr:MAG: hypothetical protein DMG06_25315 [Acidobacteriota bacterium]
MHAVEHLKAHFHKYACECRFRTDRFQQIILLLLLLLLDYSDRKLSQSRSKSTSTSTNGDEVCHRISQMAD